MTIRSQSYFEIQKIQEIETLRIIRAETGT